MAEKSNPATVTLVLLIIACLLAVVTLPLKVTAASMLNKSVVIGSVTASDVTNYKFQFNLITSDTLGSIAFQYCEDPLPTDPCIAPSGLDASNATILSQTGQTGFSIHPNTISNRVVITRPASAYGPGTVSYDFGNITNPDTPNHTTYVRISTYSNTDATGSYLDFGVAAFSINPSLGVNVFVPPYLTFCVGVTVSTHCESATGLKIDLGSLRATEVSSATTQFAGATNDNTGYTVSVLGTTMTSGNNEIDQIPSPTLSRPGTEQFGLNLRDNSRPNTGHDKEGSGSLVPASGYNTANVYKFNDGDIVASTGSATEFNRMTATYIVNIKPNQPVGLYSTTLTYVAVASF